MKVNVEVDCTPDEARRFMGLPDVAPMLYYHAVNPRDSSLVEVFEVPDTFYLRHIAGTRPTSGTSLGVFPLSELGAFGFD